MKLLGYALKIGSKNQLTRQQIGTVLQALSQVLMRSPGYAASEVTNGRRAPGAVVMRVRNTLCGGPRAIVKLEPRTALAEGDISWLCPSATETSIDFRFASRNAFACYQDSASKTPH